VTRTEAGASLWGWLANVISSSVSSRSQRTLKGIQRLGLADKLRGYWHVYVSLKVAAFRVL